jgi:hypothetical protein
MHTKRMGDNLILQNNIKITLNIEIQEYKK